MKPLSPAKVNLFLLGKLPAAFVCGVRARAISPESCTVGVRHRWINQNPFRSMYFAVQAMAAELSTGALVLLHIRESGKSVSMLVARQQAVFHKKATGKITFCCGQGHLVKETVALALATGEPQTLWLRSIGTNADGIVVAEMDFEWTLRLKQS